MKILLSIFMMSLFTGVVSAATPEIDAEFFHPAASLYIQGDSAGASNLVVQGLSVYPEDVKLKRLKELLEQEQKQDQENKQQQQDQENQDKEKQENEDQNPENEQEPPEQPNPSESDSEQPPEQEPEPEPPSSEQMSEDEAKQLLNAMKQEEKANRMQLRPIHGAPVKVDKDW
jgi:outer membrane biosynthesis protein TonB